MPRRSYSNRREMEEAFDSGSYWDDIDEYDPRANPYTGHSEFDLEHRVVPYRQRRQVSRDYREPGSMVDPSQQHFLSPEAADLLTLGRNVGRHISQYDPDSQFLRDQFGREYEKSNGKRIQNNWLTNFAYNTVGYRGNARPVDPVDDFDYRRYGRETYGDQGPDWPPELYENPDLEEIEEGLRILDDQAGMSNEPYDPWDRSTRRESYARNLPPPPVHNPLPPVPPPKKVISTTHVTNLNRPKIETPKYGGQVSFSNSEFISNIYCLSDGSFSLATFPVNGALYQTFPVLSQFCSCFVYYRFTKLQFRYVSTSSDNLGTTNVALGTVCMMVDENSASAAPTGLIPMQSFAGSKSFKPSLSTVVMSIDCSKPVVEWFFCRTNPTVNQNDPRLTDMFNFYIATSGMSSAYVCGELHVDYEVEMCSPFLNSSLTGNQNLYYRSQLGVRTGTGSATCDPTTGTGYGNMGVVLTGSSSGDFLNIKIPSYVTTGCYMLQMILPANIVMATDPYQWGDLSGGNILAILQSPSYTSNVTIIQPHCYNTVGSVADVLMEFSYGPGAWRFLFPNNGTRQSCNLLTGTPGTSITSQNWVASMVVTLYFQLGVNVAVTPSTPATIRFPGFQVGSGSATVPSTFYQGSFLITQVNPNCQYSWSSGQGILNP